MLTTNPWKLLDPDLRDQLAQVLAILLETRAHQTKRKLQNRYTQVTPRRRDATTKQIRRLRREFANKTLIC